MNAYKERGFTLIELMIVVVILGVLMLLVLPAYQDSLNKSRRADGMGALLEAANRQEKFLLDRGQYTQNLQDLGYDVAAAGDPAESPEGFYEIEVLDPNAPCPITSCYMLQATPQGVQTRDGQCTSFTLDARGNRDAEGSNADQCWR